MNSAKGVKKLPKVGKKTWCIKYRWHYIE